MNIAWIAGFFDGEGCVYIMPHASRMQVSITQKDRTPLDLIQAYYGFGKVSSKGQGCHVWQICARDAQLKFLRSIRQYSICKRKDVEVGIAYAVTIEKRNLGQKKMSVEIFEKRNRLKEFLGRRYKQPKSKTQGD